MKLYPLNEMDKFIMLNGGQGDFCLKTSSIGDENHNTIYGESWSTNTKNFLFINEDSVEVVNWFESKSENIQNKKKLKNGELGIGSYEVG